MILTEKEIRQAVLISLLDDDEVIKEFKLGAISTGDMTKGARCDFSDIPKEFFSYFKAISDGNRSYLIELIDKDIEKLEKGLPTFFKEVNDNTVSELKKAKAELVDDALEIGGQTDRLKRAQKVFAGKGWYGVATKLILPLGAFGLSVLGFRAETCDRIKLVAKTILNQVVAPLLGAKIDTSGINTSNRSSLTTNKDKGYESSTYADFPVDFSANLFSNNLVDRPLRKELLLNFDYEKFGLINFDLDFFELYANDIYVTLCKNKKINSEELSTAKAKLKFVKDQLADSVDTFDSIKDTLIRYVDLDEAQASRTNNYIKFVDAFPFENYFKDAEEAKKFINYRMATLLKVLKQF